MKQTLLLFSIPLLFLLSCNSKTSLKQTILTAQNLKSIFIYLDPDSAYNLETPKGAILRIAGNSFDVKSGEKIQLEIKEAFTAGDMLLAGLTTRSNGKLLQSAGMIYINATSNGKEIELKKPISVSTPSTSYDESMQLFKGEIENDGSINWVDPQPLGTSPVAKKIIDGKALFKANCASCHKPTVVFTGPPLAKCREREPDRDWAYRFTRNPSEMVQTDAYANAIFRMYNKTTMTAFGDLLTRDDVTAILDYCDNEGILNPMPGSNTYPTEAIVPDSAGQINNQSVPCGFDTIYYRSPDTTIKILAPVIQEDTMVFTGTNRPLKPQDVESLRNGFTDPNTTTGMYDFEIETFGWYNVDAFVEGYVGTTKVKINVQLQMQFELEMHVYLFCPERKMLSVAYDHKLNDYWFNKNEGAVPLFLNDKAIVLAFGSKTDKLFYGVAAFNIQTEQTIVIQIKETTEEKLKSLIQNNNIDGIKIDVNKKEEFKIIEIPCNGVDSPKETVKSQ